ncbi:Hypothetical protein PACV_193 [Pacmanvirus A23]|uniref:Hypothetical protein n=1 Tax=Pacmanvirus A23 TaxID=1932881 RepID=UPI000A094FF1|nr:Hypothetical protein B9W72_gp191 [Pacmanvirus A23]SIP85908.1 Hypothetical protein PACV_193 [Pacmanvirus A23]
MYANIHFGTVSINDTDGIFFVPSKYIKEVNTFRFKVYFDAQRMVEFKCMMGKPENTELTHYASEDFTYISSNTSYSLRMIKKRKDSTNFYLCFSHPPTSKDGNDLYKIVFIE